MSDDGIDRDGLMEVCIVVNGPLDMSPGKLAGQAFQAAARCMWERLGTEDRGLWSTWLSDGTRTIVKAAKTQAMFDRVCAELPGYLMSDEGFTEVEADSPTVFVVTPRLHKDRPSLLNNKKVGLL